jgi:hypothetical protein
VSHQELLLTLVSLTPQAQVKFKGPLEKWTARQSGLLRQSILSPPKNIRPHTQIKLSRLSREAKLVLIARHLSTNKNLFCDFRHIGRNHCLQNPRTLIVLLKTNRPSPRLSYSMTTAPLLATARWLSKPSETLINRDLS